MKTFSILLAATAVTALTATVASAATILIDDFNTAQKVEDNPGLNQNSSTIFAPLGDFFGNSRTLAVTTAPNNGSQPIGGSTLESTGSGGFPNPGILQFSNNNGQTGIATVTYDFGGTEDLTAGNLNDRFFFEVLSLDLQGTSFSATVNSAGGNGTFTEIFGPTLDPFLSFNDAAFVGVDFGNVTSLVFSFDSTGVDSFDASLGSISVVPLPASALLLLGGLGGFAGMSAIGKRRRRREIA